MECIGRDLEPIGAVFQRVVDPDHRTWKLARFANGHEANPEIRGQCRANDEATGFDPDDEIRLELFTDFAHLCHHCAPPLGVTQKRGDVTEENSRLGEVRNVSN